MDDPLRGTREHIAAIRNVARFLTWLWRCSPKYGTAILWARITTAFTPVAQLWVGKLIIDGIVDSIGVSNPDWGYLVRLVLLELTIAIVADGLSRASSLFESILADRFSNDMNVRIMRHAVTLDLEQFESPDCADMVRRARRQTTGSIALLGKLLGMAQQAITLLSLLIAIVAFNSWLLMILVAAILPTFFGETRHVSIRYSFMFQWTPKRRELDYLSYVASDFDSAKEVKLFGLSGFFINRYSDLADAYVRENQRIATRRAVTGSVLTSLSTLAYYGAFGFIVFQTVGGAITIGALTFLAGSFARSRAMISGLVLGTASLYEQSLHLTDLFDFLAMEPRITSKPGALLASAPFVDGIVFEGVGFRYPDAERWALRDTSFVLKPGERIALVGKNGAGKTTLVKLLTRLYDPTEGRILLDGVDLRDYELHSIRELIGVIFQDFFRYDLTVRENIAVGGIEAIGDERRIRDAARKGMAAVVIQKLERRYDQILGRRFEGGANLSGGEWQKVALSRAYMRDAQVLVLDEPTAALDAFSEYEVFRRFNDLTAGKSAVLISHRFSTVRMADRILVLDGGQIVEQGDHYELLAAAGLYARLFALQAKGYQ